MCDFRPGDEVVRIDTSGVERMPWQMGMPDLGLFEPDQVYVVERVHHSPLFAPIVGVQIVGVACPSPWGWDHRGFRKVQRRNDRLTIEAFMTMPGGFEEPRRAPAKKRERVE